MTLESDDCVGIVLSLPAKVIVWTTLIEVNAVVTPMPEGLEVVSVEGPADNQNIASRK